jgi:spermidine/putrescine-binding protein
MSNGVSRRNFAKYTGAAAMGAGLAGCLGGNGSGNGNGNGNGNGDGTGSDSGERPVQWMGPLWAAREQQATNFTDLTGIELEITNENNPTVQQEMLSGANETFDAVSHDTVLGPAFTYDNDNTDPIPTSEIDRWAEENISDAFTNPAETFSHLGAQTDKMVEFLWEDPEQQERLRHPPHAYNYNGVGYNPKMVDGNPNEYSALFDDKYEGQVAMGAAPSITAQETIAHLSDRGMIEADVGDLNNPTEDQIDTIVDFLVEQKESGQFRSTWVDAGTSVNLMASEEAIIGDLWQPAVLGVRRSGTPCRYATMSRSQGYQYWWGGIIPTKPGASDRNNMSEVYDLYNFHLGAWYIGFVQRWGYPTPTYPNTDLVRDGSDETGEGMGPEYYDWAYEGQATYDPVDEPALFVPEDYEWSMEEGSPHNDGQVRDQGSISERIERTGIFQIWPDNADYLLERWEEFEQA